MRCRHSAASGGRRRTFRCRYGALHASRVPRRRRPARRTRRFGFITRRVCVFRPSRMARTIVPLNRIGRSFIVPPGIRRACGRRAAGRRRAADTQHRASAIARLVVLEAMDGAGLRNYERRHALSATHCRVVALSVGRFAPFAPLLKQERHAVCCTLIAQISRPIGMHRSRTSAAFSAHDHPINFGRAVSRPSSAYSVVGP